MPDSEQAKRKTVLDAILSRYPLDDPESLSGQIASNDGRVPRFAIVQLYKSDTGANSSWVDVCDDAVAGLEEVSASYVETSFEPFAVVDLDSGRSRYVVTVFQLGDDSDDESHDFTGLPPDGGSGKRSRIVLR